MNKADATNKNKKKSIKEEHQCLVDFLLSTQGIRIQSAVEVGKKAIEYFLGKDFSKWVSSNEQLLRQKFPLCFLDMSSPLTSEDIAKLSNTLIRFNLIYRAENESIANKVITGREDKQASMEIQRKWPKRLVMSRNQSFSDSAFFVIVYEPPSSWPYIMLFALICGVITICMFPAWPLALKLATWYGSVSLVTFILGSVVVRLVVFLFIWFVGIDLWIFPNLFDEEKGFLDSFRPVYTFEYRRDSWFMVAGRVFLAFLAAVCFYQLNQTHSISDARSFATQQFLDVLDWGHQKLAAPVNEAGLIARNDNNAPDFTCLKLCGFHDYKTLSVECLNECSCIKELIDSPCFAKCKEPVRTILTDAEISSCEAPMMNSDSGKEEL